MYGAKLQNHHAMLYHGRTCEYVLTSLPLSMLSSISFRFLSSSSSSFVVCLHRSLAQLVIGGVVAVVFGPQQLPQFGKMLGTYTRTSSSFEPSHLSLSLSESDADDDNNCVYMYTGINQCPHVMCDCVVLGRQNGEGLPRGRRRVQRRVEEGYGRGRGRREYVGWCGRVKQKNKSTDRKWEEGKERARER